MNCRGAAGKRERSHLPVTGSGASMPESVPMEGEKMKATTRRLGVLAIAGLLVMSGCSRATSTTTKKTADSQTSGSSPGDFGTMKAVCGKGTGHNIATGRGVTADSIKLGTISDAGFAALPGTNQELWDASEVFTKWCNSLGGINGRKIIFQRLDAAVTQYKQVVLEACQEDFALVGGGGAFDATGQSDRLKCLLPAWPGFVATPEARGSDFQWQPLPIPLNQYNNGLPKWLKAKYPDSIGHVGYLTGNVPVSVSAKDQYKEVFQQIGMNAPGGYDQQYNIMGESTYIPFVSVMKQQGVKGVVWTGDPEQLGKVEQAMAAIDYKPDWIFGGVNSYAKNFIQSAGASLLPTYATLDFVPFEDTNPNTIAGRAMGQYLSLFNKYNPTGRSHAALGVNAFAGWLLFAQGADACGANLTAKCMYNEMQHTTKFTAGGLTGQVEVAAQAPTQCYTAVVATPSGFKTVDVHPNESVFNCTPDNIVTLTGNYGKGVTLADVGKSVADLK